MTYWKQFPKQSAYLLLENGHPFLLACIVALLHGYYLLAPIIIGVWFILFSKCARELKRCICGRVIPGEPYPPKTYAEGSRLPPLGATKSETRYLEVAGIALLLSLYFLSTWLVTALGIATPASPSYTYDVIQVLIILILVLVVLPTGIKIFHRMYKDWKGYGQNALQFRTCPRCSVFIRP